MIWWIPAIFSSFPVTSSPVGLPRTHTFLCHYIWPSIFLPAYLEPIGCCCCDPNLQTIASHYHHDRIVDTDCSEKINRNILFSTCIVFPPSPRVSRVPADTVLHIMMKTLHIDGVPSLSLRPSLLLYIYNWSLISKSNMRHCRTLLLKCLSLPLFQFSHCCYQQHSSCAGNNLSWYRWHLAMNSLNKRQLNNKNCPRNTRSISFKDSRIFYGEDLSFFAALFSAIKTTTNSESRWRRPQARSRWTDIQ